MRLRINGQEKDIDGIETVEDLLEALEYPTRSLAVAIGWECVPRRAFAQTRLKEQDEVEILAPQQGG